MDCNDIVALVFVWMMILMICSGSRMSGWTKYLFWGSIRHFLEGGGTARPAQFWTYLCK